MFRGDRVIAPKKDINQSWTLGRPSYFLLVRKDWWEELR